ncbi:MAG TPA: hypothetical protein VI356_02350 [Myxococcales bacterium]
MTAESDFAAALVTAFRPDFAEREATARQLAELLLDAVAAALPLTRHEQADGPLSELEALAQQTDVYAWDGAPGWDVVLARGLEGRAPVAPGGSLLDGLGARPERTQQRGELKRRAHAEADRLVLVISNASEQASPATVVAAHASLLRLVGLAAVAPLLLEPEDPGAGALPPSRLQELSSEMDARGEGFALAHEEWLALLLSRNQAAAQAPAFRTFYAGLSQALRVAVALRRFRDDAARGQLAPDGEALLGALGTWQPVRWSSLRAGAPSPWFEELCPAAADATPLQRLARDCEAALATFSRLWFAQDLSATGFSALAALFTARCASAAALWEELGGGAAPG